MAKLIELDALDWIGAEDFYSALLSELKAPEWHGHNLDALWDSIVEGDINEVEPPFVVRIYNLQSDTVKDFLKKVETLFVDARNEGVAVDLELS